ncbi:MAG: DcaP family trimeric outer membrane transporter, partial [Myxococcota bacterium]
MNRTLCLGCLLLSVPAAAFAEDGIEVGESAEPTPSELSSSRKRIGKFPNDATVTIGDFPGSIRIPGYDASVRLGGLVQLNTVYDWDSLGFADSLSSVTIPIDGSVEDETSQTRMSARDSRINFDVRGQSEFGTLRMFIEADFLGAGNELNSGYTFQLRHAAAQVGALFVGQWWSTFDDISAFPESGVPPLGAPSLRTPGIRSRYDHGNWTFGGALE